MYTSVKFSAFGRLRQENYKLKASLGYMRLCLKKSGGGVILSESSESRMLQRDDGKLPSGQGFLCASVFSAFCLCFML